MSTAARLQRFRKDVRLIDVVIVPAGLPRFDEVALSVRNERALFLDHVVEALESISILLHHKVRKGPHGLSQEIDNRRDVKEFDAEGLATEIHDVKPERFRVACGAIGIARRTDRLASHHEICQFPIASRSDLLGETRATGSQNASDLLPVEICRMSAHDEFEGVLWEWQCLLVTNFNKRHAKARHIPLRNCHIRVP
jgi:hypothetical protein